jgi:hypothetical protein
VSEAQRLLDAVRRRTEGTPYVVEETFQGFDVRIDIEDTSWYALMYKQHLSRTWVYHVAVDEAGKTLSITDDVRAVDWKAGTGVQSEGGETPVPVLSMAKSGAVGRFESKSFRKTYAFNDQGEYGKVVDYTFDAAEGRDLIRGPARELGWTEKMGAAQRTGVVVAVSTIVLLVLAGIVVGIVALAGGL